MLVRQARGQQRRIPFATGALNSTLKLSLQAKKWGRRVDLGDRCVWSVLEDELSHVDVEQETDTPEGHKDRGSAVAH